MMRRFFVIALASLTIASCASAPQPNAISLADRDGVYVKTVSVEWKFDDAAKANDTKYQTEKTTLQERLQNDVSLAFKSSPSGSEPVTFVVEVKSFFRMGAAQQILVGGGDNVVADVHIIRLSDNKEIGVYSNITGSHVPMAGILGTVISAASQTDIVAVLSNSFAKDLRAKYDAK